ncbi:hypothetical protein [Paenibacillus rhizophilus]|uniref:DUF4393 domain-containing protein n=1 Tax=Paenibacillus rhizophilus TaxID=1850366 RepID=A0A3N9PB83_9BACL|nr:hypothetical protein [Paenibacillus rhizophilus]RQW12254.1 hypothetical protein EH198_07820 [Paenibacillus rhizophilus]
MNKEKILTETGIEIICDIAKQIPLIGPIIASPAKSVLLDIASRHLSKREEFRVSNTAKYCIEEIKDRVIKGGKLRDDDFFFSNNEIYRSSAEEIFEGVLIKCKNEHEEKKSKFISNIFINISFSNEYKVEEANHLLKVAEDLTYRQLCLIRLFKEHYINPYDIRFNEKEFFNSKEIFLLQEIHELSQMNILNKLKFKEEVINRLSKEMIHNAFNEGDFQLLNDWGEVIPARMVPSQFGYQCYYTMGVKEVPNSDLDSIIKLLRE